MPSHGTKDVVKQEKYAMKKKDIVIYITSFIFVVFAIIVLIFPESKEEEKQNTANFSDVSKICELATLRCYYHDVAEYEKQPDGLFKYGLFQYGYKKFWLEYDGIVEIGIDVGQVRVEQPDENGVVRIYVPDAQILNIGADETSMSDPIAETGVLTSITAEEKAQAFSEAQSTMRTNAESDSSILNQAKNNAKELLKRYVLNVGEQIGQTYTVEWLPVSLLNNSEGET